MKISLTQEELSRMLAALRQSEDCEEAGDGSFTVDLFDEEPVLSLELYPEADGFSLTAAAELSYSEEMDGYYLSRQLFDEEELALVVQRLKEAFACS